MHPDRWQRLMAAFALPETNDWFDQLLDAYSQQHRHYHRADWVPAPLFRSKRAEILESFLARPLIYSTAPFRDRYEVPARRNLAAAIAALRGT